MAHIKTHSGLDLHEREVEVARCVHSELMAWMEHVAYPDEINTGGCESFAVNLAETLEAAGYNTEVWSVDTVCGGSMVHTWVYVPDTDRHYDSEVPYGVEDWHDMPLLRRTWVAIANKPSTMDPA